MLNLKIIEARLYGRVVTVNIFTIAMNKTLIIQPSTMKMQNNKIILCMHYRIVQTIVLLIPTILTQRSKLCVFFQGRMLLPKWWRLIPIVWCGGYALNHAHSRHCGLHRSVSQKEQRPASIEDFELRTNSKGDTAPLSCQHKFNVSHRLNRGKLVMFNNVQAQIMGAVKAMVMYVGCMGLLIIGWLLILIVSNSDIVPVASWWSSVTRYNQPHNRLGVKFISWHKIHVMSIVT